MATTIFEENDSVHDGDWRHNKKDRSKTAENMALQTKWTQVKLSDPPQKIAVVLYGGNRNLIHITSNGRSERTFKVEVNLEVVARQSKNLKRAKACAMHTILDKIHGKVQWRPDPDPDPDPEPEPMPMPMPMPMPEPMTEPMTEPVPEKKSVAGQIEGILEDYVSTKIGILEQKVSDLQESVKDQTHRIVVETRPGTEPKVKEIEGLQHEDFEIVLHYLKKYKNLMLVGPAGSGKTTLIRNATEALDREFFFSSSIDQKYEETGYNDINGEYVDTELYRAVTFDGPSLYFRDETDNGNPRANTALNPLIDNGFMTFTTKRVDATPDTSYAVACNTYGWGGDLTYVRNQLDGAFKNRFIVINIDYDKKMEMKIALSKNPDAEYLVEKVQAWRVAMNDLQQPHIIGPRNTYNYVEEMKDLKNGDAPERLTEDVIEFNTIWQGMDPATVRKIKETATIK